jgi:hypothetical protein
MSHETPPRLFDFALDLARDETLRRAEVAAALGGTWDPIAALRAEDEAHALLYSGLDERQQATYDLLVSAGILPGRGDGRAAD